MKKIKAEEGQEAARQTENQWLFLGPSVHWVCRLPPEIWRIKKYLISALAEGRGAIMVKTPRAFSIAKPCCPSGKTWPVLISESLRKGFLLPAALHASTMGTRKLYKNKHFWSSQLQSTGPSKDGDLILRLENASLPHTFLPHQQGSSTIAVPCNWQSSRLSEEECEGGPKSRGRQTNDTRWGGSLGHLQLQRTWHPVQLLTRFT